MFLFLSIIQLATSLYTFDENTKSYLLTICNDTCIFGGVDLHAYLQQKKFKPSLFLNTCVTKL